MTMGRVFILNEWHGRDRTVLIERLYDNTMRPFRVRIIQDHRFATEQAARDFCTREFPAMEWELHD